MYFGKELPPGWLICDGSEVSQDTYKELYDTIGDSCGTASAGKFRLPNFNNRFPEGTTDPSKVGTSIDAAVPNLYGYFHIRCYDNDTYSIINDGKLFSNYGPTDGSAWGIAHRGKSGANKNCYAVFNANKYNSTYKDSASTVQPAATQVVYIIYSGVSTSNI